ncbi:hypothetical protein, partial [Adlercreutzia caecimuris]|uniref:hypothetical protein n=1 Tax=Adlercreutzia caecimuris TaxID=671266 RepID=UPI001F444700
WPFLMRRLIGLRNGRYTNLRHAIAAALSSTLLTVFLEQSHENAMFLRLTPMASSRRISRYLTILFSFLSMVVAPFAPGTS